MAFRDNNGYHLFVMANRKAPVFPGMGGYLVHLVSDDLKNRKEVASVLDWQYAAPQCSDYFFWNE